MPPQAGQDQPLGVDMGMKIFTYYMFFFSYVLACILRHFGSEYACRQKEFFHPRFTLKSSFSVGQSRGGWVGGENLSPEAKTSHSDFRTDCGTKLI